MGKLLIGEKYGYELTGLEYSVDGKEVIATFKNGETVKGSVIVGSDGPRSKVREIALGPEKADITPLEIMHSNVAVKYKDAEKAKFVRSVHPICSMGCHPTVLCFMSSESLQTPSGPQADIASSSGCS